MDKINELLSSINGPLWTYGLVILLIGAGLYFSFRTRFVQFRHMGLTSLAEDPLAFGHFGITNYQAFAVSLASRVGVGTITGVATAIAIGGPGVVFWMWLLTILGMASAFIEGIVAQIYKVKEKEDFMGGPVYYLSRALKHKFLAIIFAILMIVVYGFIFNLLQVHVVTRAMEVYNFSPVNVGIVFALITFLIIMGGQVRIASFCAVFVPIMLFVYLFLIALSLILNFSDIPRFFLVIFQNAFTGKAALGGTLGMVILQGVQRGFYTSEAGMGSAPHAAAIAHTSHPVKQGAVQSFSVFFEMFIICGGTAFMIITTGFYSHFLGQDLGWDLMRNTLFQSMDIVGVFLLTVTVVLFGFTTIIGNYFYAEMNLRYLTKNHWMSKTLRVLISLSLIVGAISAFSLLSNIADLLMAFIAIINIYAIIRLFPVALKAIKNCDKQEGEGKDPVFSQEVVQAQEPQYKKLQWPANQKEAEVLFNDEDEGF